MASKIAHLSELESIIRDNEKTNEGVLHFFSTFKIRRFLGSFGSFKSKGFDVSVLLLSLLIFRLRSESICRMQNRGKNFLEKIDDNTFYRPVSYTHLRAHETDSYLVCRLLLEKKKNINND